MSEKDETKAAEPDHEFKLRIPELKYQQIMHWVNKCTNEVSGFGSLDWCEEKREFTVREVHLCKQQVTSAETEMDADAIGKLMYLQRDEPNALKWHWHSHGTMGVFWSGTDRDLIKQLSKEGWLLASVFNQKEEVLTAFSEPVEVVKKGMFFGSRVVTEQNFVNDIPTVIILDRDPNLVAAWDKEFADNVRERNFQPVPYQGPGSSRGSVAYIGGVRQSAPISESHGPGNRTNSFDDYEYGEDFSRSATPALPAGTVANGHRRHTSVNYNEAGYVDINGKLCYNPCFDEEICHSRFAVNSAIDDMSPDEVEVMAKHSPVFQGALGDWKRIRTLQAAGQPTPPDSDPRKPAEVTP